MARGPLAAAGGLYEADCCPTRSSASASTSERSRRRWTSAARRGACCGFSQPPIPRSTGTAATPTRPAIAWASENLPGIDFFVSGDEPPLPLADGSLDLAYAISIWSHFAPRPGTALVRGDAPADPSRRPSGRAPPTASPRSPTTPRLGLRTPQQSRRDRRRALPQRLVVRARVRRGGRLGRRNPDWGTAFLSPEWMLAQLCPRWRVLEFAPGRNQDNQDVYVLQRV